MFSIFSTRPKIFNFLFVLLAVTLSVSAQQSGSNGELEKSFRNFDLVQMGSDQALQQVRQTGSIQITASGRTLVLALDQNDLRSRTYRAEDVGFYGVRRLERAAVNTYRGRIENESGSQVRMTIDSGKIEGYFVTRGETYFVEAANRYDSSAPAGQLVIYKKDDFLGDDGFSCPSDIAEKIEIGKAFVGKNGTSNLTIPGVVELATEADFEYVNDLGGPVQANSEIMGILNMVDGVFEDQLGLKVLVTFQHTWSVPDPFNGTNANSLLTSFQNHWNTDASLIGVHRDATHLFSSKTAVLSMGYAYLGTICRSPASAYGLSGRVTWAPAKYLVTAHELGHNLNAAHAEAAQGCASTIMNPQLSGGTAFSFCPYSVDQINAFNTSQGSCLTPPEGPSATTAFDFDGDTITDISIFRPAVGQWWYSRSSDGGSRVYQFGNAADELVPADYTGDGFSDVAFFRPATGEWYVLRSEDSSFYSVPFGTFGDIPAPGDYDGDGRADLAVFRPSTRIWYVSNSSGGTVIQQFGAPGDMPVAGDYDGDGSTDIAIFRPSVSEWWINKSTGGVNAFQFGAPGDKTVQADYTGDGKTDVAIWRPSNGAWYVLRSEDSSYYSAFFGTQGDIPVPGDYDGDGLADNAVWRPSDKTWYMLKSLAGFQAVTFGSTGDTPVPSAFVQ